MLCYTVILSILRHIPFHVLLHTTFGIKTSVIKALKYMVKVERFPNM